MSKFCNRNQTLVAVSLLGILLLAAIVLICNTENSFGGGDHFTHFKLAYWGWQYPKLLFNHWGKPLFTILISPFAQLGINTARLFNVIAGLFTAYLSWKLSVELKLKNSLLVIFFVVFIPIYFSLMFSVMTEVLHSMFLVLAVLLFFKKDYFWSAIVVSLLPMVRTESIVLLPLFVLAFGLKKQWKVLPLLLVGFVVISFAGWHFYDSFWWLITEMPYKGSASGIYGHGSLFHFVNHAKGILGYPITGLFYIGTAVSVWFWYKKDRFHLNDRFFFLLLVPGIYFTFLAAHSFVWWKGMGNSLGLIRVIGAVSPLAAITTLAGFNFIESLLQKQKTLFYIFTTLLLFWIGTSVFAVSKNGFQKSKPQEVLSEVTSYICNNKLKQYKIYYFNNYIPYKLKIDPYNNSAASWGIPNSPIVSYSIPDSSLIVWDAHFGPNEGRTPLKKLLNDKGLEVVKIFKPEKPFTVLGGYNYEVYLFKKKAQKQKDKLIIQMDFEGNNPEYTDKCAFSGKKSYYVNKNKLFLNLFNGKTTFCKDSCLLSVSGEVFFKYQLNSTDVLLVVSKEGTSIPYFYHSFGFKELVSPNIWTHFDFNIYLPGFSGNDEVLKVYFWNKHQKEFWIDDIKLIIEKKITNNEFRK